MKIFLFPVCIFLYSMSLYYFYKNIDTYEDKPVLQDYLLISAFQPLLTIFVFLFPVGCLGCLGCLGCSECSECQYYYVYYLYLPFNIVWNFAGIVFLFFRYIDCGDITMLSSFTLFYIFMQCLIMFLLAFN